MILNHFTNLHHYFLEKEMATHSSIPAWRIPRTEGLGWLQSIGSQRVRHNWVAFTHLGFPGGSVVKNPPANTGASILVLGNPLEKEMAAHSSILSWKIPWTEEPRGLQSMGSQKSWTPLSDRTTTLFPLTGFHAM